MFALMGIGPMELLILAGCTVVPLVILGVVGFVVYASGKKNNSGGEAMTVLEEENARLRAENARLKNGNGPPGPPGQSPFSS